MERCIVLNGDYSFLNTVSWKRAIALSMKGKTEVITYSPNTIMSASGYCIKIPLVIKLMKAIRMIYKNRVPYSKRNVIIRDKGICVYCGDKKELTIDHVIPKSRGGKTNFENCVASCKPCNNKKGSRMPSEANMFPKRKPVAPTISEFLMIKMKHLGVMEKLKEIGVY